MKIQLRDGGIVLTSGDHKVIIGDELKLRNENYDLAVAKKVTLKDQDLKTQIINSPGEYEAHGIMVQAVPVKESARIELFSLDVEGINVIFIDDLTPLPSKKILEQLGLNNILIYKIQTNADKIRDVVDTFEPEYLIPITASAEHYQVIAKKLGISLPEKQSSISTTVEDFDETDEEKPLTLFILE
jgi:hypothetical protein